MWNERDRRELVERIERLSPDMQPLWGQMDAPMMLAHLGDWIRMSTGELRTAPRKLILRYPGVKHAIIKWLPFPKGVPTAPELVSRKTCDWATERAFVCEQLSSFETLKLLPAHPAFGNLSRDLWGRLGYRHTDHHLKQFGV